MIENCSITCHNFNSVYKDIVTHMMTHGNEEATRGGNTIEVLNFKTTILNPVNRCVGGYGRNINIFFLLYEALWIWSGKKDVASLTLFNSNMKNFSDDGETFHAPYGFRLRNYGIPSKEATFIKMCEEQGVDNHKHIPYVGLDQIKKCVVELKNNPEDRKVVASIWNPMLDLGIKTKDTPCNDMLMFKIRNSKLHLTIQNRSNDIHWGLPTNVFQFSFILELMAKILRVEVGTQTHNSQSLHLYMENPITLRMLNSNDAYVLNQNPMHIPKMNDDVEGNLKHVDDIVSTIIQNVVSHNDGVEQLCSLDETSVGVELMGIQQLLLIYIDYIKSNKSEDDKRASIGRINILQTLNSSFGVNHPYILLAKSFFAHRIKSDEFKKFRL